MRCSVIICVAFGQKITLFCMKVQSAGLALNLLLIDVQSDSLEMMKRDTQTLESQCCQPASVENMDR